jgi:DNA repair protein RadC
MRTKLELPKMLELDIRTAFEKALAQSIGDEKAKACTRRLLKRYGSLVTVMSESAEEIARAGGVSMNTALLIKLIGYVNSRRVTEKFEFGKVHTELEIREFILALFLGSSIERVYTILFDKNGRTLSVEHINDGTVNASDVVPRKVLEFAKRKNAASLMLAHNHPKGSAKASNDDMLTTGRLAGIFASVGVNLIAHYIVADGEITKINADAIYGDR